MIKVYKSQLDLFHAFMYGDESFEGTSSNVFAEGNKLYSFGYHYMLAKLENHQGHQYILLNNIHYGQRTAQQQCKLSRCIPENYIRIYVEDPSQKPSVLIQKSIALINERLSAIKKATSRKLQYLYHANDERKNILKLVNLYPSEISLADYNFLKDEFKQKDYISQEWLDKQAAKEEQRKIQQEKEDEIRRLKGEEQLAKWLNFEVDNCYSYSGLTRCRYNLKAENVETTLGIKIHKDKVKELYNKLIIQEDIIGLKIEQYTVLGLKDNVLTIGCHKFNLTELLEFGKQIFEE